jgi:hypothetical protein
MIYSTITLGIITAILLGFCITITCVLTLSIFESEGTGMDGTEQNGREPDEK